MKNTLIGFDFSINKPAACILKNNQYKFVSWPFSLSGPQKKTYDLSPAIIISREDNKDKGSGVSDKLRYEVKNSVYLANLIVESLKEYKDDNIYISFEGLSYGSTGDVVLQLGGYKYMLMDKLTELTPLKNMFTYAPTSLKKTAGCSKKGMGKPEMIETFKLENNDFSKFLKNNEEMFKTPKGNWIGHLDDIVDSYWALRTLQERENL